MKTIRALFAEECVNSYVWIALTWIIVILVIAYALAIAIYARKIRWNQAQFIRPNVPELSFRDGAALDILTA